METVDPLGLGVRAAEQPKDEVDSRVGVTASERGQELLRFVDSLGAQKGDGLGVAETKVAGRDGLEHRDRFGVPTR